MQWKYQQYIFFCTVMSINFHIMDFFFLKILWMLMATVNCLVTNILQNILFCDQQKIEIHTGLE